MAWATIAAVRDAIQGYFNTAWAAAYAPAAAPMIAWQDTDAQTPKDNEDWVRFKWQHKVGFQATIANPGNRRFRSKGTITVEIRTAMGGGLTDSDTAVNIVQGIFEGQTVGGPDGVIFRDVTPVEVGPDGTWFQTNVIVSFEYDRIK